MCSILLHAAKLERALFPKYRAEFTIFKDSAGRFIPPSENHSLKFSHIEKNSRNVAHEVEGATPLALIKPIYWQAMLKEGAVARSLLRRLLSRASLARSGQVEVQVEGRAAISTPLLRVLRAWTPSRLSPAASAHLDLIRAIAAWAVMWGHLRTMFFVDFHHLQHPGWLAKVAYFITGLGHQAVMVFFVLSGFLISSTVIKSHLSGTWSWREYAINRATRLYVVLIPGLLLGLFWDLAGSSLFASTGIYAHPVNDLGTAIASHNLTAGNFFCNLFFLQTIVCSTFGSNAPLWSLANEFWYYALFPLVLSAGLACTKKSLQATILLSVLAFGLVFFLGLGRLIGFVIWLSGCALVFAYSRFRLQAKILLSVYLIATSLLLLGCLVAVHKSSGTVFGSDLAVGIVFTLFLFGVLQFEFDAGTPQYSGMTQVFAGFSYSLYVLHFPLILFLRTWIVPPQRWQPNGAHVVCAAFVGLVVLSFAWLVSLFTENKTKQVRDWIRNKILAVS